MQQGSKSLTELSWNQILTQMQEYINPQDIETWFSNSSLISSSKERVMIEFPDGRQRDHVNQHYLSYLQNIIHHITGRRTKIDLLATNAESDTSRFPQPPTSSTHQLRQSNVIDFPSPKLNPRFNFNKFVVGPSNEIAHAASLSVGQNPGMEYNPLFLWGGVGLGKTHLLQAIAHKVSSEKPYLKVLYVTSEQFVNEIVEAIHQKETSHFKLKYRYVDILLIDDIQFIQDKKSTEEEFFHTFNALYDSGRQIVISSDRPTNKLTYLTDRIRNRFEWGLISKIEAPDFETRVKILSEKAKELNLTISDEILFHIAKKLKSDIRALEGAITDIQFHQKQTRRSFQLQEVENLLRDRLITPETNKQLTVSYIVKKVGTYFQVSPEEITAKSRAARLIIPRFIAIYLATKNTNLTTKQLGKQFGGRDHSTIINARKEIEKLLPKDPSIQEDLRQIEAQL